MQRLEPGVRPYPRSVPSRSILVVILSLASVATGQWTGLVGPDETLDLWMVDFGGSGGGNTSYYDGDFGDFDGDGRIDRALGARFGLIWNAGGGFMVPVASQHGPVSPAGPINGVNGDPNLTGFTFGSTTYGDDAFQFADIDNDGDLDVLSGGNEPSFLVQENRRGRFVIRAVTDSANPAMALNIVNTDIDGDGDVDILAAHAFCSSNACGGPVTFRLFVNDGTGHFPSASGSGELVNQAVARGLPSNAGFIVGAVSGDVDGDGDYDIVLKHGGESALMVCLNDGTGHFTTSFAYYDQLPAGSPRTEIGSGFGQGMNLGDIDDDGDLDLVLAQAESISDNPAFTHAVFVNDGAGNFTEESATRLDAAGYPFVIQGENGKLVDLDYDGDLDFVSFQAFDLVGAGYKLLAVMLNDGDGHFTYSAAHSHFFFGHFAGTGSELDVTDLDGDGVYDVWVGLPGDRPRPLFNTYEAPGGVRPDVPREFTATVEPAGVVLSWKHPAFAANARSYEVYRSTSPTLPENQRPMIKVVGERHQDEGFAAPITRHTTTEYLGDPTVTLIGSQDEVRFLDATAVPGVTYYYSVCHVGTENTHGRHTALAAARIPPTTWPDTTAPVVEIVSPTADDWNACPRIVVAFADDTAIDAGSLHISFDQPLGSGNATNGGRAAGADVTDLVLWRDETVFTGTLTGPLALPAGAPVTMTVSIADEAGHVTTRSVTFQASVTPVTSPTARLDLDTETAVVAPATCTFDAGSSVDADGVVMACEWYFDDGTCSSGTSVTRTFTEPGIYSVKLVTRDNEGGLDVAVRQVLVAPARVADQAPIAVAGPDRVAQAGQVVDFDGSASTDPDHEVVAYTWDLGDGRVVTGVAAGVTHVYELPGEYVVTLTVSDGELSSVDDIVVFVLPGDVTDVVLPSSADSELRLDGAQAFNYGGAASVRLHRAGGTANASRPLFAFDLAAIPAGASIASATLELTCTDFEGAMDLIAYPVVKPWTEGLGNGEWSGAAGALDVSWYETQTGNAGNQTWSNPGGDVIDADVASVTVESSGLCSLDMTDMVTSWHSGVRPNYGLMLRAPTGADWVANHFATKEHGSASLRPRLRVTYTIGSGVDLPPRIGVLPETGSLRAGEAYGLVLEDPDGPEDLATLSIDIQYQGAWYPLFVPELYQFMTFWGDETGRLYVSWDKLGFFTQAAGYWRFRAVLTDAAGKASCADTTYWAPPTPVAAPF